VTVIITIWRPGAASQDGLRQPVPSAGPVGWFSTANLVLLGELRRRAPDAINWEAMGDVVPALEAARASQTARHH
jgi:hypothetical protein